MNKKHLFLTTTGLVVLILLGTDSVRNSIVGFLLAGLIPGTAIIIPFWAMVALWCLVITALATYYIETILTSQHSRKSESAHQSRMPRRRYSSI